MSFGLTLATRRFLGAALRLRLLARGDICQHLAEPFVLDDRGLLDLLQLVEGPVGQGAPLVLDLEPTVRIVEETVTRWRARGRVISFGSSMNITLSYCSVRLVETVRSSFQAKASSRWSCSESGR